MSPKTAMVLAAGLGTRMRPLTNTMPKPLIPVGGRPLIDHMLDRLLEAGVERCVVNTHYCANQMQAHLAARTRPSIVISEEVDAPLETGGALKKARALLQDEAIFVANTDSIWDGGASAAQTLAANWDPSQMDVLLLIVPLTEAMGFDGDGDFFLDDAGRLTFRGEAPSAPYAYMGLHICKPGIVDCEAEPSFSLAKIWRRLAPEGRLFGAVFDGFWMHVGDPQALAAAEARLAKAAAAA